MLEMFFTKPILQGNDEIHQLEVINSIMGTPREDDWPQVRDLPWYELVKPKVELRSKFRESFSKYVRIDNQRYPS
jgi:CTD kinase subunit alpha